jgi:hypothetical protein
MSDDVSYVHLTANELVSDWQRPKDQHPDQVRVVTKGEYVYRYSTSGEMNGCGFQLQDNGCLVIRQQGSDRILAAYSPSGWTYLDGDSAPHRPPLGRIRKIR